MRLLNATVLILGTAMPAGSSCAWGAVDAPTCSDWRMIVHADQAGHEITWEIVDAVSGLQVATGGPYMNNSHNAELVCLPLNATYRLIVHDSGGNGICPGGYALEDPAGDRVIDNMGNGCTYGSISAVGGNLAFSNPIGPNRILNSQPQSASCSKLSYLSNDFFIATPSPGVNPSNGDGYQFWIFDPNGSYNRRVFQTGSVVNGWNDSDPNDACYLRFAWLNSNPVPMNLLLNVAVRTRINGVFGAFGPVCQAKVLPAMPACLPTWLVDHPQHPDLSCGVTRSFGGADELHAISVNGATDYRFRFETDGGGFVRLITSSGSSVVLNWTSLPLSDGAYYDVTVQPSFDGGSTWCPAGPACTVLIDNTPGAAPRAGLGHGEQGMRIADPLCAGPLVVHFDEACAWQVIDLHGRLHAQGATGEQGWHTLALDHLAQGIYLLHVLQEGRSQALRFVRS